MNEFDLKKLISDSEISKNYNINNIFEERNVYVYGAGSAFHWLYEILIKNYNLKNIVGVIDKKFNSGEIFYGFNTFNSIDIDNLLYSKESILIVCLNDFELTKQIKKDQSNNFFNIISINEIYELQNPFNLPKIEKRKEFFKKELKNILFSFSMLSDDKSKKIFYDYIKIHLTQVPETISKNNPEDQFIDKEVFNISNIETIIQCGADFDVMKKIFNDVPKLKNFLCCEASKNSFNKLKNHGVVKLIEMLNSKHINTYATNKAIWSNSNESLSINETDSGFGSMVNKANNDDFLVEATTIDELVNNKKIQPDLITFDIEGSETNALYGCKCTIKSYKPLLGVSTYHKVDDLWNLPKLVYSLNNKYNFQLRNYTGFSCETVLYAQ
tara:strand:+ start:17271 stop:18422 length:1152 start_codon:yes stop_codon:yes gene_type:complete